MKKKILRITESDLHNIIKESVNNILKEICEIDDMKSQFMSSDWDLHDAENLKQQQMTQDWDKCDANYADDRKYFDRLQDDNYLNDYNGNINDYYKEKENFPF